MSTAQLEKRLKALEDEVALLKSTVTGGGKSRGGWTRIVGTFAGDPLHERAMKAGRKYRQSRRGGTGKRR